MFLRPQISKVNQWETIAYKEIKSLSGPKVQTNSNFFANPNKRMSFAVLGSTIVHLTIAVSLTQWGEPIHATSQNYDIEMTVIRPAKKEQPQEHFVPNEKGTKERRAKGIKQPSLKTVTVQQNEENRDGEPQDFEKRSTQNNPTKNKSNLKILSKQKLLSEEEKATLQAMKALEIVEIDPTKLLNATMQEAARRKLLREQALENAKQKDAFIAKKLAEMTGDEGLSKSNTAKSGINFTLFGKPSPTSKVVNLPELLKIPHMDCEPVRFAKPATVRLAVSQRGTVWIAFLMESSSIKSFDQCALRHAKAMVFKPAEDAQGNPLTVWIHVIMMSSAPPLFQLSQITAGDQ